MTTFADILLDDLEAIFGEFGWAVDAVYRPVEGDERAVRVIFDNAYQDADPKTHAPVGSRGPAAFLQESDLPAEAGEEDRLVIGDQAYRIVVVKPDGHGSVLCRLQAVSS